MTQGKHPPTPKRKMKRRSFLPLIALIWAVAMVGLGLVGLKLVDELRKPRPDRPRSTEIIGMILTPPQEVMMTLSLYFASPDGQALMAEERIVPKEGSLPTQIRAALVELTSGPQSEALRTVPPNLSIHSVYLLDEDTAVVDVGSEIRAGLPGGSTLELLCIHSIVNTVTQNFPQIKKVRILVESEGVRTVLGHVDLSQPLPPAPDWVRGLTRPS